MNTFNGFYVFGGNDKGKDKYYSDLYFLEYATLEWYTTKMPHSPPLRVNHSAVWDSFSSSIIVVGGKGMNLKEGGREGRRKEIKK